MLYRNRSLNSFINSSRLHWSSFILPGLIGRFISFLFNSIKIRDVWADPNHLLKKLLEATKAFIGQESKEILTSNDEMDRLADENANAFLDHPSLEGIPFLVSLKPDGVNFQIMIKHDILQ